MFDDEGIACKELDELAAQIESLAIDFFEKKLAEHNSLMSVRAASAYIQGSIGMAECITVMNERTRRWEKNKTKVVP